MRIISPVASCWLIRRPSVASRLPQIYRNRLNFHTSTAKPIRSTKVFRGEDNFDGPTFNFPEEPLGLPADSTFGFFQGGPGDLLGPSGRYLIQAKLGHGVGSNVWLAKDTQKDSYVALKILSGYATSLNQEKKLCELVTLQRLVALPGEKQKYCTQLLDHFIHRGIEEDGNHLCLVLRLDQAPLSAAWKATKGLPVPIVKRIVNHVLHGLSGLHACGIAHTDLKPANIMIARPAESTDKALDDWLARHPPRVYGPIPSFNKTITAAFVSEDLPLPSVEELAHCDFRVGDLSHSQIVDNQTTDLGWCFGFYADDRSPSLLYIRPQIP